jgi:hypothetical protein
MLPFGNENLQSSLIILLAFGKERPKIMLEPHISPMSILATLNLMK